MRIDENVSVIVGTPKQIEERLAELERQRVALTQTSKEEDPRPSP